MERFGRLANVEVERYGRRDIVTSADRDVEELVTRRLAELDPDIPILGEEAARGMASTGDAPGGAVWVNQT